MNFARLYLIEILHQTTTISSANRFYQRCILSKFYIKPQLPAPATLAAARCILSKFYIKPQLIGCLRMSPPSCILSKFYIKPQQQRSLGFSYVVVSYRNSTSNHNSFKHAFFQEFVVSYRNSTSNHNKVGTASGLLRLYLIEILHQTTTGCPSWSPGCCCILSKFYIKPQPSLAIFGVRPSCILSKFYIKPQQWRKQKTYYMVVSYRNSTSNHNYFSS